MSTVTKKETDDTGFESLFGSDLQDAAGTLKLQCDSNCDCYDCVCDCDRGCDAGG